jgi:hypothetical protein
VQNVKARVGRDIVQPLRDVPADIEFNGFEAGYAQSGGAGYTGNQRDLSFLRQPTHQDGNF